MSMIICRGCGNQEPVRSRFCGECGTSLEQNPADTAAASPVTAADPVAASAAAEEDAHTSIPAATWPEPVSTGATATPNAAATAAAERRWLWPVVIAALALVLAPGAAAGWLLLGKSGSKSVKAATVSPQEFMTNVNNRALQPLADADANAQADMNSLSSLDDAASLESDGIAIATAADQALVTLKRLQHLAPAQAAALRALRTFITVNRQYGEAVQEFSRTQGFASLSSAASAAAAAGSVAAAGLSVSARVPAASVFKLSEPPAAIPTQPAGTSPVDYFNEIDTLLTTSHETLVHLQQTIGAFNAASVSGADAARAVGTIARQRQQALDTLLGYNSIPAGVEHAHKLLVEAMQLSIADDVALSRWMRAKDSGAGNADALFAKAEQLGRQASDKKRVFLAEYRRLAQNAVGGPDSAIPNSF